MLGIVIVTHGKLGEILLETSEIILNAKTEAVAAVSINLAENVEKLRQKIETAIKSVNANAGILILTDMFGGTPSNLSYSFLEEGRTEVISGVNMPVLLKAINLQKKAMEIHQMAKTIEDYGKKSISLASDILKGNKRA